MNKFEQQASTAIRRWSIVKSVAALVFTAAFLVAMLPAVVTYISTFNRIVLSDETLSPETLSPSVSDNLQFTTRILPVVAFAAIAWLLARSRLKNEAKHLRFSGESTPQSNAG